MMTRWFRSLLLGLVLGLGVGGAGVSFANIPVIDPSNILALVTQGIQEIKQLVNMINSLEKQYSLSGKAADSQIQSQQNIATNEIVRLSQNHLDVFNQQLTLDQKPAIDACNTYNVAQTLSTVWCDFIANVGKHASLATQDALGGDINKSNLENERDAVDSVLKEQNALAQTTGDSTAGVSASSFINPQLGGYSDDTAQRQADLYRKLVLGPLPAKHIDPRLAKSRPYVAQKMQVQQESLAARKSVAATSLSIYQAMYTKGGNGVSPMGMMEKFVKDRFEDPKWIAKITNTSPDKGNDPSKTTTLGQVQREMAEEAAFSNYMQVKMYQSQLRDEVLLSTLVVQSNQAPASK